LIKVIKSPLPVVNIATVVNKVTLRHRIQNQLQPAQ